MKRILCWFNAIPPKKCNWTTNVKKYQLKYKTARYKYIASLVQFLFASIHSSCSNTKTTIGKSSIAMATATAIANSNDGDYYCFAFHSLDLLESKKKNIFVIRSWMNQFNKVFLIVMLRFLALLRSFDLDPLFPNTQILTKWTWLQNHYNLWGLNRIYDDNKFGFFPDLTSVQERETVNRIVCVYFFYVST